MADIVPASVRSAPGRRLGAAGQPGSRQFTRRCDFSRARANHVVDVADEAQERFGVLFAEHRRIALKVAGMYCANPEDRRDVAQEIATQLWRAFPRYDESRPFSTWMYRIALNVAISFVRRASRERSVPVDGAELDSVPVSERPDEDERVGVLRRLIAGLDDLNRALVLLYLDERSYREMSEILGISETNVATKLNRIKERIRKEAGNGAR
jgi:RNA polymerase sigma factor (sigma-70 family)